MRWLSYGILAYLIVGLHGGLSGFLGIGPVFANLVLPVALFIIITNGRERALLGAFALGCVQDLFTQQPFGLYAFSYGLVALFIVGMQPAVYYDHPVTHFALSLAAALLTNTIVLFNDWAYPILHDAIAPGHGPSIWQAILSALYTAAVSVLILGALFRLRRFFGIRAGRVAMPGSSASSSI